MEGEEEEGEDDVGPIEVFGIHRLELAPGTKSGYVGVRPNNSKSKPWQAWLSLKGEKRRTVGSYKHPQDAAVARAAAKVAGAHLLRSPRKQASRKTGAAACRLPPVESSLSQSRCHCACSDSQHSCTGKRSAEVAFTPLTQSDSNQTYELLRVTDGASAQSSALLPSASFLFASPFTSDGVQRARPLLPGEPLPMGVAAVAMAVPVHQPHA